MWNRKEQILNAAKDLFSHKGFHATSMRDIADAVGLQSGSLYTHIRSKEDILFEFAISVGNRFSSAMEMVVQSSGTPTEKLRRAMVAHLRIVASDLPTVTIYFDDWRSLEPERREKVKAVRDRYEEMIHSIIEEGVKTGEFRPMKVRYARTMLLSVLNWTYQWYSPRGVLTVDELAEIFSDIMISGLRAPNIHN